MRFRLFFVAGLLVALAAHSASAQRAAAPEAADLIVTNAQVTTLWPDRPSAEAVAVHGGQIARVGASAEIAGLRGDETQVIDANGRRLIPGLNDSHSHFVRGGRFYNLELRWDGVPSLEKGLAMIRKQAQRTPDGEWVRVIGGWSPYQFAEKRFPTPAELTEAAPDTPVFVLFLYSRGFLNEAGVEALGLEENAEAPPGARYDFVDGGARLLAEPNPTILYETIGALPQLSETEQINSTRQFYRELNRFGLTSTSDAGGGGHVFPRDYVGTKRLADDGAMPLRVSYFLFPQTPGEERSAFQAWLRGHERGENAAQLENGYVLEGGGEFLTWDAGDFENFTAPRPEILERPYMRQELYEVTRLLARNEWPIRIHATYDESISKILDVFEEVDRQHPFDSLRCAIEHAETISPENIQRVKALGCGIAVQSRMAFAGEFFKERYGAEAAGRAPPLRAILEAGVPLGAGTDATRVSTYNPWVALYWMVSGKSVGGTPLLNETNQLSRKEALRRYTVGSAWFSGEEDVKGRLAPGQMADFALLSADYFEVEEEEIKEIESVLTVVGGEVVYGAEEFADLNPPLLPVRPAWSPVARFGGYFGGEGAGAESSNEREREDP